MRTTILTLALVLVGGAQAAEAQIRPDPGRSAPDVAIGEAREPSVTGSPADLRSAGGCLEPRHGSYVLPAIDFEGWRFEPSGSPEPILADNLDPMGEHRGFPLFAGKLAVRPIVDLWIPVCAPADHYQLYTRLPAGPRPAGF